jgi:hypothetical protein
MPASIVASALGMRGQRHSNPVKRGQTEVGSGIAGTVSKIVQSADTKAALALATTLYPCFLNLAGAYSIWSFSEADHTADVTADPTETNYIAPDGTGASGAWVKRMT